MSIESKFILTGGFSEKALDGGMGYCLEATKGIKGSINILECTFSLPIDKWENVVEKDKILFSKWVPDREIVFSIASPDEFIDQISNTDILILRGGSTQLLLEVLKKVDGFRKSLINKVVVGQSAGAYVLAKKFLQVSYSGKISLGDGLGILPIKVVAHYRSDFYPKKFGEKFSWEKVDCLLSQDDDSLEIVKLKEGEFLTKIVNET
jgi:peptidase E